MNVRQTTIRLPPDIHNNIRILAIKQGKSMTKLILEAIKEKLNRED